jgi:hypothetical protein
MSDFIVMHLSGTRKSYITWNLSTEEVQPLKIYIVGDVIAGGGSDQVVTTTAEDHLDIKKEDS